MKSFKQIFNYIFCQNYTTNVSEDKQEVPVATLPKDEYGGIGEPIKSFLECFKSNPKRFKFYTRTDKDERSYTVLMDIEADISYRLDTRYGLGLYVTCSYELQINGKVSSAFSKEELYRVYVAVSNHLDKRKASIAQTKASRTKQKLMKVYCNEK